MVSGIENSSILQALKAHQALKGSDNSSVSFDFVSDGKDSVDLSSKSSNDNVSSRQVQPKSIKKESDNAGFTSPLLDFKKDLVNDLKQFISKQNDFNINNEDIDHALRYGTSILVDKRA
jgi:hypothetical protein